MSIKSKIAAIAAASLGMVLTQGSAARAETEDSSAAPEKVTKIAAPIDVNELFYSAIPDEALERAAASTPTVGDNCGGTGAVMTCPGAAACNTQVKRPPVGGLKYQGSKPPLRPTLPPKSIQQNKNK